MFKCNLCNSRYLNPRPSKATIALAYAEYPTHNLPPDRALNVKPRSAREYIRRAILFGYLNSVYDYKMVPSIGVLSRLMDVYPPVANQASAWVRRLKYAKHGSNHLLDVGCGSGGFLYRMALLGWDVTGLEFDAEAAGVARGLGLNVIEGTLDSCDLEDETFDAITLGDVIEHLHDPIEAIKTCYRLLRKGGVLYISTPNGNSLGHSLMGRYYHALQPPYHLVLFTPESLVRVAESVGFSNMSVQAVSTPSSSMRATNDIVRSSGKLSIRNSVYGVIYGYFGVLTGFSRTKYSPFMESFGCLFRKPF